MKELKKTEVTTVIAKPDVNEDVRNAIDPVKYDEYRKQWEEATKLNLVTDFPLQIDFELNYSCNFTCPMCTWNAESLEEKGQQTWFDFEVFKEVIDDGVSKGLKSIRFNYINEPLIRKDIVKFISYAHQAGIIDTYFSTNGSLLSDDITLTVIASLTFLSLNQSKGSVFVWRKPTLTFCWSFLISKTFTLILYFL